LKIMKYFVKTISKKAVIGSKRTFRAAATLATTAIVLNVFLFGKSLLL